MNVTPQADRTSNPRVLLPLRNFGLSIAGVLKNRIGLLLFLAAALVGIGVFDDYGITWDEEQSRNNGLVNYDYIFAGSKELLTYRDRDYGIAVELPLIFTERILALHDLRHVYLLRHFLTHLFFLLGAYCCFSLTYNLYRDKVLASIGFLLFTLCPHLYAHSFFNSKDVPFAAMFMICFYLCGKAFARFTFRHFLLLGAGVGLLINIRVIGVIMLFCISLLFLLDYLFSRPRVRRLAQTMQCFAWFLLATMVTLYVSWPFLWEDPIGNLLIAMDNMSRFRWHGYFLFQGNFVMARSLPWYYIPVCFSITTPLGYLAAGVAGITLLCFKFLKHPILCLSNSIDRHTAIYAACFAAPVGAVIVFHSVLYDSWRHLYFIYPAFVMLALYAIGSLLKTRFRLVAICACSLYFAYVGFFMIRSHPFQHVYFNELNDTDTPEYLRSQYELDYWGASYKQAFEHILRADNSTSIIVCANYPAPMNAKILPPESRQRLTVVPTERISEAKYFVTNYRYHPQDYPAPVWHAIKVGNNTISGIYRLK